MLIPKNQKLDLWFQGENSMEMIDYNKLFDCIKKFFPNQWEEIVFYAVIGNGRYSMKFFIDLGNGEKIDCLNMSSINKTALYKAFSNIYNDIQLQRASLTKHKHWSSFIMHINSNGKFNVRYDYDDISSSMLNKIKEIEKEIHINE